MKENHSRKKIIKELKNFSPFCEQETTDKKLILKFIKKYKNIASRENNLSHLTASTFILNKERTKVLFIYHNIYDSWCWVGGHADGDYDLLNVVLKETHEETNLKNVKPISDNIFSIEFMAVNGHLKKGKYINSHFHLNLTYILEADENEPVNILEEENSAIDWINLNELSEKSSEPHMLIIYKKIVEKLRKEKII